jgi:RNA polymerase sigma factor (sigma-70 family)
MVRRIRHIAVHRSDDRSDADLLHAFLRRHEEEAFAALVVRYEGLVLGVCRRVLGNAHDAEDARQATFLVLAREAARVRQAEALPGWLYSTAHRIALQAKRAAGRRRTREERICRGAAPDPVDDVMWREIRAALDEEIQRLPDPLRSAFLLCCMEGVSHAEAGKRLGIAEGSVSSRVTRARQRLHRRLERRGIELSAVLAAIAVGSAAQASMAPAARIALTEAGLAYAAGRPGAGAGLSESIVALANGVSRTMWTMPKLVALVLVTAAVLGAAAKLVADRPGPTQATTAEVAFARETPAPAPATSRNREPKPASEMDLAGRVLGPDGKPVPHAKLLALRVTDLGPAEKVARDEPGATDANGRFRFTLRTPDDKQRFYLVAHARGLGVDWVDLLESRPARELVFRLPLDVPISGRVVNTEGKAIAGVSVSAVAIYVPRNGKLDEYLDGWLKNFRDNLATPEKRLYVPLDHITGAATTGKDGRFTLRGAGAERIVQVTFTGGGVARATPYVITRADFDPKPYNDVLLRKEHAMLLSLNRFHGLYPPSLTFVAEAGKTISGMVKDAASGKPLPGCRLYAHTGFGDGIAVFSDADGQYRIEGVPKNAQGYGVSVAPPQGQGFLNRNVSAADTEGFTPIRLDVELTKGVVVTGRVVDKQTGKGVQAGVRFAPLPDNKFFGSRPGFDNYRSDRTMEGTGKDGRFRLVTIPGKALVTAQVHEGEKLHGEYLCPYRAAAPDPDHKDLFRYDADNNMWVVTTAGGLEFLSVENAVKVIDIKESGETTVELVVDRGVTGRLVVQDADGKPLAGAWVAGLAEHWPITFKLTEPTATVFALNPQQPRTLAVFHPEKKLGGTVTIRGDEKEPVVVKLAPLAQVTGRFLDADGNPLVGAEVTINARGPAARELYRFARPSGEPVKTDAAGRFTVTGVVPGISFYLQTRQGENYFVGKPKIGLRRLKAGEHLDLGDRRMEVMR